MGKVPTVTVSKAYNMEKKSQPAQQEHKLVSLMFLS